jgi:hypothetical protein
MRSAIESGSAHRRNSMPDWSESAEEETLTAMMERDGNDYIGLETCYA